MEGPFDARAVIRVEFTYAFIHVVNFGARHFRFAQLDLAIHKAYGGDTPQV